MLRGRVDVFYQYPGCSPEISVLKFLSTVLMCVFMCPVRALDWSSVTWGERILWIVTFAGMMRGWFWTHNIVVGVGWQSGFKITLSFSKPVLFPVQGVHWVLWLVHDGILSCFPLGLQFNVLFGGCKMNSSEHLCTLLGWAVGYFL
jgi:hypothetical protein